MRPSLEAVSRFDPERARKRFLEGFEPASTFKIVGGNWLVGFFVVREHAEYVHLDQLYIVDSAQGSGVGSDIVRHVKARAHKLSLPVWLCAMKGSGANGFF